MHPQPSIEPGGHQPRLTGRGKTPTEADLRSMASAQASSNRQTNPRGSIGVWTNSSTRHRTAQGRNIFYSAVQPSARKCLTGPRHSVASTTVTIPAILYALLRWTASAKIRGSAAGPVRIRTWSYRSPWSEPRLTPDSDIPQLHEHCRVYSQIPV